MAMSWSKRQMLREKEPIKGLPAKGIVKFSFWVVPNVSLGEFRVDGHLWYNDGSNYRLNHISPPDVVNLLSMVPAAAWEHGKLPKKES